MGFVVRAGRVGRCMERKCDGGVRVRESKIQISGRVFDKFKEGVWGRRRRISKSGRIKEVGIGRKVDGRVCAGVQAGSKRKWI